MLGQMDIESVLIQIGNILKGITGGCTKFKKKPSSYLKILGARRVT
jgi:hypothetical protein